MTERELIWRMLKRPNVLFGAEVTNTARTIEVYQPHDALLVFVFDREDKLMNLDLDSSG